MKTLTIKMILLLFAYQGICQNNDLSQKVPEAMNHYSFLVGSWEFHWKNMQPDKSIVDGGVSYSKVYPIMSGFAICDDFLQFNGQNVITGSTIRSYDPTEKKLTMKWVPSGNLIGQDFVGEFENGSLIFWQVGKTKDEYGSYKVRITFYDIGEKQYSWKTDRFYDDGYVLKNVSSYIAYRKN